MSVQLKVRNNSIEEMTKEIGVGANEVNNNMTMVPMNMWNF